MAGYRRSLVTESDLIPEPTRVQTPGSLHYSDSDDEQDVHVSLPTPDTPAFTNRVPGSTSFVPSSQGTGNATDETAESSTPTSRPTTGPHSVPLTRGGGPALVPSPLIFRHHLQPSLRVTQTATGKTVGRTETQSSSILSANAFDPAVLPCSRPLGPAVPVSTDPSVSDSVPPEGPLSPLEPSGPSHREPTGTLTTSWVTAESEALITRLTAPPEIPSPVVYSDKDYTIPAWPPLMSPPSPHDPRIDVSSSPGSRFAVPISGGVITFLFTSRSNPNAGTISDGWPVPVSDRVEAPQPRVSSTTPEPGTTSHLPSRDAHIHQAPSIPLVSGITSAGRQIDSSSRTAATATTGNGRPTTSGNTRHNVLPLGTPFLDPLSRSEVRAISRLFNAARSQAADVARRMVITYGLAQFASLSALPFSSLNTFLSSHRTYT